MLVRLFWLIACPKVYDDHVRDWEAWDLMGLARCAHCKRRMAEPEFRRRRL